MEGCTSGRSVDARRGGDDALSDPARNTHARPLCGEGFPGSRAGERDWSL